MIEPILFPYVSFPVRLEIKSENRICWFKDDYDLQKYLERYKLNKRTVKIDYRDGESTESGKTNKTEIQQGTGKNNNRSSGGSSRSTKNLDGSKNTYRTRKSKK